MNIVDILIIIVVLFGMYRGFRSGFTTQLVSAIGTILVFVFAFILKGPIGNLLSQIFPFFNFSGILSGITSINIILYEAIAFILLIIIFTILLRILLIITGIFEKVLSITWIFGIPSKISGAIVGGVQYYIYVFVVLYLLSFPVFNINLLNNSTFKEPIINNTPILSKFTDNGMDFANELTKLKDKYKTEKKTHEFNLEVVDLLLKYKIVSFESVEKLVEDGKLKIDNIHTVLDKYKKGE